MYLNYCILNKYLELKFFFMNRIILSWYDFCDPTQFMDLLAAAGLFRIWCFDRLASRHFSSECIIECFIIFLSSCRYFQFNQLFTDLFISFLSEAQKGKKKTTLLSTYLQQIMCFYFSLYVKCQYVLNFKFFSEYLDKFSNICIRLY